MTPHLVVIGGLIAAATGFFPLLIIVLRWPVTPAAYLQFLTAVVVAVFLVLSFWPNGPRFDHWVGATGAAWLIYQTALVATPLTKFTTLTLSTSKDWKEWRHGLAVVLGLVVIFWVAGVSLARTLGLDHTSLFYRVAAGRPLASLVMNVAVGAALFWASFLCFRLCRRVWHTANSIKQRRWALHLLILTALGMVLGLLYAAQAMADVAIGDDSSLFPLADLAGGLFVTLWLVRLVYHVVLAVPLVRRWLLVELEPDRVQLSADLAAKLDAMSDLNRTIYDQAVHLFEYTNRAVVTAMDDWCIAHRTSRYERSYLHLAASMFTLNRAHLDDVAYRPPNPEEIRAADEEMVRDAQFRSEIGTFETAEAGRVLQLILDPWEEWRKEPPGVRRDGAEALVNILRTHKLLDGGPFTAPPPIINAAHGASRAARTAVSI